MGALDRLNVVIAGAGAVGCCAALELARAGAAVTMADQGPNASASAVAAGMLAPAFECLFDDGSEARFDLLRIARDLWPELADRIGLPIMRAGAMAVGAAPDLEAWSDRLTALGVPFQPLTPAQAHARSPLLRQDLGGLLTEEDWRLEPQAALGALHRAGQGAGVRFEPRAVTGFREGRVWFAEGDPLAADALVVATGASRALAHLAPELAALAPIKGHILRAPDLPLSGPVLRFAGGYACPGQGGAVIGASMEPGIADDAVDRDIVAQLRALAGAVVPSAADTVVTARTGVRAATADGLPLVGPSQTPAVWLAVGARRNGWLLAPLMAATLCDSLSGAEEAGWARAFAPARFDA